jgi:quinol monooxygenase YgiN
MKLLEAHFETEHFTRLVPKMDTISSTFCLDVCSDKALTNVPVCTRVPPIEGPLTVPYVDTHVIVTKDVDEAHQGQWLHMAQELVTETRKEAGCKFYSVYRTTPCIPHTAIYAV